jgi:hypothetical protein
MMPGGWDGPVVVIFASPEPNRDNTVMGISV